MPADPVDVVRDVHAPRRLAAPPPDRGTYWHLEQEVSTPIDRAVQVGEHPERFDAKYGPPPVPTMEELEVFEQQERARAEEAQAREDSGYGPMLNEKDLKQRREFLERQAATAQRSRVAKRRKVQRRDHPAHPLRHARNYFRPASPRVPDVRQGGARPSATSP